MSGPLLINAGPPLPSPARERDSGRGTLKVGAVQESWRADSEQHLDHLAAGISTAVAAGAQIVFLQELTLSPYFAVNPVGPTVDGIQPEDLLDGPTFRFAAAMAYEHRVPIHASLYERIEDGDELGFNTAILVAPDGSLIQRTRKLHIPVTEGYREDMWFRPGPADEADGGGFPVTQLEIDGVTARIGLPTCWDQWFPEVARAYSLADADLVAYTTAIGSEPDHPNFDTEPLWQKVIVGNAIANGLFVVAVNRTGREGPLSFYGSSFICDPYGRVLCQAPRDQSAVLVAELDLAQRRDWLELFPFLRTRRPDAYQGLAR